MSNKVPHVLKLS